MSIRNVYALAATLTSNNPVLAAGEWGIESDTGAVKVGDGVTAWASLQYTYGKVTTWTPTITQGSAVTGTLNQGWYIKRADKTFEAHMHWAATAAGTGGNPITVSLPVTLDNLQDLGGSSLVYDASGPLITVGIPWPSSTTAVGIYTTSSNGTLLGSSPSFTIASGDIISISMFGRWA